MGYKTMSVGQLLKTAGGKIKTGILNTKDNVSDYVAEKREQSQETQRLIRQGQPISVQCWLVWGEGLWLLVALG